MMTDHILVSNLPIPPGEYLEEVLEELGMSKDELARRMDRPASKLSPIFKGEKAITPETALQLETVLSVPAHLWLGLESEYRLAQACRQQTLEQEKVKQEVGLVSKYCYSELVKLGFVKATRNPLEKVRELRRYLGVTSLSHVAEVRRYQAAFRRVHSKKDRSPEAVVSWLRLGELKARKVECAPFNRSCLSRSLEKLHLLTSHPSETDLKDLKNILAAAGVALVDSPHFPKTHVHGATFWLGPQKAVVLMSTRDLWARNDWFSLFHEIGHILLHDKNEFFLEDDCMSPEMMEKEKEADQFARSFLIL